MTKLSVRYWRTSRHRLDHPPNLLRHLGDHRRRLVTVQLRGLHTGPVDGLDDPTRQLVAKDTDREDLRRKPPGDVEHLLRGDLARRRRKDESDGVGTHGNREQRIVLIGDATDLDEHVVTNVPGRAVVERDRFRRQRPRRRPIAAAGSAEVTKDSPTRIAS